MSRVGIGGMHALLVLAALSAGGMSVVRIEDEDRYGTGLDEPMPRKQPPPRKREPAVVQKPKPITPDAMTRQRRRAEERAAAKARGQS